MRVSLLIFGCLSHDSEHSLAGVLGRLAGLVDFDKMLRECPVYGWLYVSRKRVSANRASLDVAVQPPVWRKAFLSCHADSLRRSRWRSRPVEIKRHHYQSLPVLDTVSGYATFFLCAQRAFIIADNFFRMAGPIGLRFAAAFLGAVLPFCFAHHAFFAAAILARAAALIRRCLSGLAGLP